MVKSDQKSIDEPSVGVISEKLLRDKIYTIRGQRVMLDADLAEIYGYTTSAFNQQVKNNVEKFEGEDFMFQLTRGEVDVLMVSFSSISLANPAISNNLISKNLISKPNGRGGNRKLPYAFTEQGIYMLMTVLRGELAVKQSRTLIRLFKVMKDYIIENQAMLTYKDNLEMVKEVMRNTRDIAEVNLKFEKLDSEVESLEGKMREMCNKLGDVVVRSEISPMILNFSSLSEQREFVFMDGELTRANELYADIYGKARKNIYIIDNYVSVKTLRHLLNAKPGVEITIFTDNNGRYLCKNDCVDFEKEREDLKVRFVKTEGLIHDRFIVVDYGTKEEVVYHCGASEKDAGKRLMMISKLEDVIVKIAIREAVERLMGNEELELR